MRQRKTPLPPIIDNDPKSPIRPFWADAAKTQVAFEKTRDALQNCHTELRLQAIPRRPASDARKPLVTAAKKGRFNQEKQWLLDALRHGAAKAGTNVKSVMAGNQNATRKAAQAALGGKLRLEKSGKTPNTAQKDYAAQLRNIYMELTGDIPRFTRSTTTSKTKGPYRVTGDAPDFFRAAMAPLGASDDKVAEAILGRK